MLGMTWGATLDGALDHINAQNTCMSNALDAISRFLLEHPEWETDANLTEARIALL